MSGFAVDVGSICKPFQLHLVRVSRRVLMLQFTFDPRTISDNSRRVVRRRIGPSSGDRGLPRGGGPKFRDGLSP